MHRSILSFAALLCILLCSAVESRAQLSLSSSSYLDRVLRTEESPEAETLRSRGGMTMAGVLLSREAFAPECVPLPGGQLPAGCAEKLEDRKALEEKTPFWSPWVGYLSYEYARNDSKNPGDSQIDKHQVLIEASRHNQNGFYATLGARYVRSDSEDDFSNSGESNSFVLTIHPKQEILHLLMRKPPAATGLLLGSAFGYRHTGFEGNTFGTGFNGDIDALTLVPMLILVQGLSKTVTLSQLALFTYETSSTDIDHANSDDGSTGVFSLLTSLEIAGPAIGDAGNIKFIPSAEWKHDVHRDATNNPLTRTTNGVEDDWAEFVAKIRWPLKNEGGIILQYTVDTLRSDWTEHRALLGFEWVFGSHDKTS
jgi:hypothetical protein